MAQEETIICRVDTTNNTTYTNLKVGIENWYNVEGKTYTVILAYYTKDNRLIEIKGTPVADIEFDDKSEKSISDDFPENADYIKVFLWNSSTQAVPLCKSKTVERPKNLRVLAIGNSFVDDPLAYLTSVSKADGVTLTVKGATHGGASLENHWNAWQNNTKYYWNDTTIDNYLDDGTYDIITIQQVSHLSGDKSSYLPYAENIVKYLREKQPTAEIVFQETWAYEQGKSADPETMHNNTKSAVEYYCEYFANVYTDSGLPISLDGKPLRYIPTGDAVWNARQNDMFKTTFTGGEVSTDTVTLWRDGYHLSHPYGRYLAALTWYGCITGNSVIENKYSNTTYPITDFAKTIIKEAVDKAITEYGKW